MNRFLYVFFTFIQIVHIASASNFNADIDSLIWSHVEVNGFSGNVLVAEEGNIIFKKSYGLADKEWNILNSDKTKFRIASITKQFTATLIMQLVQLGTLDLYTPISKYLPYYRRDTGDSITIHHLLTHTSGLPEYAGKPDFFPEISKREYTRREFIEQFCSDTLLSKPGTKYKYSNTGYYILGAIIEQMTQKNYANVLQENILDVAGMKNTGVDNASSILQNRAMGYNCNNDSCTNADYINIASTIFSAGALYSTTEDLLLWDRALFTDKLLSKESKETMLTPFLAKYGYGVGVTKFMISELDKEMHFVFHQGAINGFRTIMTHIVNEDIVIILLCNNFDVDLNPISNAIFSILHNQPYGIAENVCKIDL